MSHFLHTTGKKNTLVRVPGDGGGVASRGCGIVPILFSLQVGTVLEGCIKYIFFGASKWGLYLREKLGSTLHIDIYI